MAACLDQADGSSEPPVYSAHRLDVPVRREVGGRAALLSVGLQPVVDRRRTSVIPGYTRWMKTAISVPDDTFEKATRRAHDLGMSRSEFFARAAAGYLDELDAESVTCQIDLAVDALAGGDDPASDAVAVARRLLGDTPVDW